MYDQLHRIRMLSAIEQEPNKQLQKGLYEWLLCDHCEAKLQKWEDYVARILSGRIQPKITRHGRIVWVEGIEYKKFKLFLLSILWRSSVATGRLFENVALGTHEEPIRQMLLGEDPGPATLYPCLMNAIVQDGEPMPHAIVEPTKTEIIGKPGYRFVFGGHLWAFVVSDTSDLPSEVNGMFLNENGVTPIFLGELSEMRFLHELLDRLQSMGRLPS